MHSAVNGQLVVSIRSVIIKSVLMNIIVHYFLVHT